MEDCRSPVDGLHVEDDQVIGGGGQGELYAAQPLDGGWSRQKREDDGDGLGTPQTQAPRGRTRDEVEVLDGRQDPGARRRIDVGAVVEDAADGAAADTRQPSDVGDRDAHPIPLLMEPVPVYRAGLPSRLLAHPHPSSVAASPRR